MTIPVTQIVRVEIGIPCRRVLLFDHKPTHEEVIAVLTQELETADLTPTGDWRRDMARPSANLTSYDCNLVRRGDIRMFWDQLFGQPAQ